MKNIIKLGVIGLLGLGAVAGTFISTEKPVVEQANAAAVTSPDVYYASANTSSRSNLLSSLRTIISANNTSHSYDTLWDWYGTTDRKANGKIQDYYSCISNFTWKDDQCGNYSGEGDKYNREHSIPKSWWGGSKSDQGCDVIIVVPTDGWVNSMRSNWPFGIVDTSKSYKQSSGGYSKLGTSVSGYGSGTVFECADEWKGDFARVYFYAITRWDTTRFRSAEGAGVFDSSVSSPNYGLTDAAKRLFLKWHTEDPVSSWETTRNDNVQSCQGNRNPYIDHPEWVDYIWGGEELNSKTLTSITKSGSPTKTSYTEGETFNASGLTVTAHFDDSSTENVTSSVVWTPSPLTPGTTSVTGTYTYKGVSKTVTVTGITVTAKTLSYISVSGQKTNYVVGDTFVKPTVTAHYTDSTEAIVTNSATFSGFNSSTEGTKTITVSYGGKSTTYTITVSSGSGNYTLLSTLSDLNDNDTIVFASNTKGVTAGALTSNYLAKVETVFNSDKSEITTLGDGTLEFTAHQATGGWTFETNGQYLSSGAAKSVSLSNSQCIWELSISSGNVSMNVVNHDDYGDFQYNSGSPRFTTYTSNQTAIQIYHLSGGSGDDVTLDHIEVVSPVTTYQVGDTFDEPDVIAYYSDDTYQYIVDDVTFTGYSMDVAGNYIVTVSYGGKTTTYSISVTGGGSSTHGLSIDDPLTVTEAIQVINDSDTTIYYVKGLITQVIESYTTQYNNASVWISDDENNPQKYQLHRFHLSNDPGIAVGNTIIVHGKGVKYNNTTYEMAKTDCEFDTIITIEEKANEYATAFNNAHVCGTNNTTSAIASVWASMKTAFNALDSYTKNYLKNAVIADLQNDVIKECLTRYERVLELHGSDTVNYSNFMNRSAVNNSNAVTMSENNIPVIIIVITLISFSACVGYFTLRKKHN